MDPMDEDTHSSSGRLGSESGPSGSTSGTAQANTPSSGPGPSSSAHAAQVNKRRRGLGVVTPNACTECRKKRAKCDGQKPCSRCKAQKDVECVYEVPVRQSKEDLRSEIDHLRRQQRSSESIFSALSRSEHWDEILQRLRSGQSPESISGWLSGEVNSEHGSNTSPLSSFGRAATALGPNLTPLATFTGGNNGSFTPLASSLGRNSPSSAQTHGMRHDLDARQDSPWNSHFPHNQPLSTRTKPYTDAMGWAGPGGSPAPVGSWGDGGQSHSPLAAPLYPGGLGGPTPEVPELKVSANTWTDITDDSALVQHLLALYFCWEYPTFASLSKEHFLRDMEVGRHRFCSPILINALLALGCRFSTQPNTRADHNNPYTSGDHFFKESQRLLYQEDDHHSLTTIQALGIMSIREASCGRDSESWYYAGQSIRLAIEMGLHRIQGDTGDNDELAVKAATFWGAFALDHAWSLATGSLPQSSCFPHLPPKPGIIDDIEASLWIPYTDDGAPLQRSCEQPSNVRSVYKCFCELSELVHQSLYILHSPGRPLSSRDLLSLYTQYLNWYDKIPEVLRLGHNFTPAVLFAHMYYHFAILLLFRPLIKLRIIGSSIIPKDVCAQAADAIHGLLRSYSQLYTLRRTPSFVPYFVLTSSIMHLAIGAVDAAQSAADDIQSPHGTSQQDVKVEEPKHNPRVIESVNRGIADLAEMAPCHQFAEQALSILRYLAKSWGIEVNIPNTARGYDGTPIDPDQSVRPTTSSLNFFAPSVTENDFTSVLGKKAPSGPRLLNANTEQEITEKSAKTMENPLFWPFPMQGRPMLPAGDLLKEAGFLLLHGNG